MLNLRHTARQPWFYYAGAEPLQTVQGQQADESLRGVRGQRYVGIWSQ